MALKKSTQFDHKKRTFDVHRLINAAIIKREARFSLLFINKNKVNTSTNRQGVRYYYNDVRNNIRQHLHSLQVTCNKVCAPAQALILLDCNCFRTRIESWPFFCHARNVYDRASPANDDHVSHRHTGTSSTGFKSASSS